ncbi:MAG: GtrA family protein [Methanosarcinales archaeon]
MFASGIYNGYYLIIFNTISYSIGMISSYIPNKKWTFKDKSKFIGNKILVFNDRS